MANMRSRAPFVLSAHLTSPPSVKTQDRLGRSAAEMSRLDDGVDGILARQEGLPYWHDSLTSQAVGDVQGRGATSEARLPWIAPMACGTAAPRLAPLSRLRDGTSNSLRRNTLQS